MAIKEVNIPLYNSSEEEKEVSLTVKEFAGRIILIIDDISGETLRCECYFDDLLRGWNAVKRY